MGTRLFCESDIILEIHVKNDEGLEILMSLPPIPWNLAEDRILMGQRQRIYYHETT